MLSLKADDEYYIDKETGFLVFTENYHLKRGYCCGEGCRHCPYVPRHTKGSKQVKNSLGKS